MSAQLENGYTRIANEILEKLYSTKFNGTQFRILLLIFRYTYGFSRKSYFLSQETISQLTGINKRQIQREISFLIESKVILVYKEATFSTPAEIGFNKYFDDWCIKRQQVTNLPPVEYIDTSTDGKLDTSTDGKLDTSTDGELVAPPISADGSNWELDPLFPEPKENSKESIKENSKESIYKEIFEHWNSQKIIVHRNLTPEIKKAINQTLKKLDQEQIMISITHYGIMLHDKKYQYCEYKWDLATFLKRGNGCVKFTDNGEKWINYQDFLARGQPGGINRREKGKVVHIDDADRYKREAYRG